MPTKLNIPNSFLTHQATQLNCLHALPFQPQLPHIYPCLNAGKYEERPSKLASLFNTYLHVIRYHATSPHTEERQCKNSPFWLPGSTFGNFSVLSRRRYLCFSLLSNRTTQRTAKGRTVSYMLRNIRIHMEKTLISKSLPRTWHSKETYSMQVYKRLVHFLLVLFLFFHYIFSPKPEFSHNCFKRCALTRMCKYQEDSLS